MKKLDYRPLPPEVKRRTGMKVSWLYYDNEADARKASEAAIHNGRIDAGLGYDFGYCSPGSIRAPDAHPYGPEYAGLWEVCIS